MRKNKNLNWRQKLWAGLQTAWTAWGDYVLGAAWLALGAALAISLWSYAADDPSLNTAAVGPVQNILGLSGAYLADFGLQVFGLIAWPLAIVFLIWGWRGTTGVALLAGWARALILPVALILATTALATIAVPTSWPFPSGLGGWLGQLFLAQIHAQLPPMGFGLSVAVGIICGVLGTAALALASGLSFGEWAYYGKLTWALLRIFALRTAAFFRKAWAALLDKSVADDPAINPIETPPLAEVVALPKPPARKKRALVVDEKPAPKLPQFKQQQLELGDDDFQLPPLDFLKIAPKRAEAVQSRDALEANTRMLESVLANYGVQGEVVRVRPGPVVTLYEMEPAPGTKAARVIGLADDIARNMSALSARIAMVPGRSVLGVELPNQTRETIYLRELLELSAEDAGKYMLPLILGKDIGGEAIIADLARMPHLLIAGTTGSGKSVAINTMILSLLYRLPPDRCKLIMIDPKMLELSVYQDIPHLLTPVVTEPKKAIVALKWAVKEMNTRYQAMSKLGVRNIEGYNIRLAEARKKGETLVRTVQTGFDPETGRPVTEDQPLDLNPMPLIVVVVDEMADLMMVAGKEIEGAIQRLAQMARAAGIHLIMATQRPSVDVITGTIKANFPTRISFQVTSKIDSRTILGEPGAEQLLGQGDMLYMAGGGRITRVHGPYVSDAEVEAIAKYLRAQGTPSYLDAVTAEDDEAGGMDGAGAADGGDDLYRRALQIVLRDRKASTSFIQRHLAIGYNRAARIMDEMEERGIVSAANATGKREILIESEDQLYG
jgi:S-DNA-T family DNA segregation ATPase FtsK/SpoIIIE